MIPTAIRPGALALALTLLAIAVAPASASAAGPTHLLSFQLRGSHGYRLTFNAYKATTTLNTTRAKRGAKRGSFSTYLARRAPGRALIGASFGHLGRISMHFHPAGPSTQTKPLSGCRGADHFTIQRGFFLGDLRFRGEGGYTSVNTHRAPGKSVTPATLDCSGAIIPARANPVHAEHSRGIVFEAGFRQGLLYQRLVATGEAGQPSSFFAYLQRTEGALAIERGAIVSASSHALQTNNALSVARLSPPAPFTGTGFLTRKPSGARLWGGDLAVSFPGEPDVGFTGPLFKTRLTRDW